MSAIITKRQLSNLSIARGALLWFRRIALGILIALLALGTVGFTYQTIATQIDQRNYPAPDQLVNVGGYRLHLRCSGAGSPTVILEAGIDGTSAGWAWVQPDVANTTRVCAYDRAGMGWSDAGPAPRDARQVAHELHALLERAGIDDSIVLVGHSFGGLFVREYAAEYPKQVVGMVLIDATHPDLWKRLPPQLALPSARELALFAPLAQIGLFRARPLFPTDPALPARQRGEITALNATTKSITAIAGELRDFPATAEQLRVAGDLGAIPLVVLTAENTYPQRAPDLAVPAERAWRELQDQLAGLSSNSVHEIVPGTTHESLVFDSQHAQATIAAIRRVVAAARTHTRLSE